MTAARWIGVLALLLSVACASTPRRPTSDPLDRVEPAELYRIGMAHQRAGDTVRAEQYLAAALARGYDDALIPLLQTCATGSRYGAALHYARRRLAQRPDNWRLRYLTAELLGAMGRDHDERAELETLVSEVEGRPELHYALAASYERGGFASRAAFHYRRYLALAPTGRHAREAKRKEQRLRREARKARR